MGRVRYIAGLAAAAVALVAPPADDANGQSQVVSAVVAENVVGIAVADDGTPVGSSSTVPVDVKVRHDGRFRTITITPR